MVTCANGGFLIKRILSFCCLAALLLSLCACAAPQLQTLTLSPFSAELSFSEDGVPFDGVFEYVSSENMKLVLRAPALLQGVTLAYESGEVSLSHGEARLSGSDTAALSLRVPAAAALFELFASLGAAPQTLTENAAVSAETQRGTAVLHVDASSLLPLTCSLGDIQFSFSNHSAPGA